MKVLKKVTAIVCVAAVAGMLGVSNLASPEVTYAADTNHDDWLHTDKDKILDMNGNEVWLTGANWFGFNCTENVFHGAWYDVKGIVKQIADRGINIIRVPISSELMVSWMNGTPLPVSSVTADNNPPYHVCNPDFADPVTGETKNSWEIFQYVVQYCKEYGIKILMDAHSPHSDNSGHSWELWYGKGGVDTKLWMDSWVWLADQFKDDDTIVAFDLENEPHGKRQYDDACPDNMARWDDTKLENNWKNAAETCGKAILDVNPHLLILVEGIEQYPKTEKGYTFDTPDVWGASGDASPWYGAWWGGNLRGVRDYPINFGNDEYNHQLVYSPHDYGPSVYNQTWFDKDFTTQTLLDDYWYDTWAYIDAEGIAPLLIGEWGGHMDAGKNQHWMELLRDYMIDNHINHTFWCINPNSGDTGGLIGNDWATWDDAKYSLFEKSLWQDKNGVYIGLDHMTPLGENGQSLNQYYGGTPSETVTTPKTTTPTTPKQTTPPTTTTTKVTTTTTAPVTTTKPVTTTPIQTTVTTTTPVVPPDLKYGDFNGDGIVEMTDLTLMSQDMIGDKKFTKEQLLLADVNGDGNYNLADLGHLKQYIMMDPVILGPQPE